MTMFSTDKARELLEKADVFFGPDDDEPEFAQMINFNDTWSWASADGEYVTDAELIIVAELFWRYGWCGILYWAAEKNQCRSEFLDNNRFIDFVRQEEAIRREVPDSNKRAYHKAKYTLGE